MPIFPISLLACIILILALRTFAHHTGMMDHPDERKQHSCPTPTVGGVAMFLSVLFGFLLYGETTHNYLTLLACAACLVALGVLDDRHNLSVRIRLMTQVVLTLVVVHDANGMITSLGTVWGLHWQLGIIALPFSLIAYVGAINAMNMIDGSDGMAGSMALISTVGIVIAYGLTSVDVTTQLPLAVAGALCGFLLFNARIFIKRARVFMGDAGSMWLGLVVAWMLAQISQSGLTDPWVALWLFGLPLIDTLAVMGRRIHRKKSPFKADRTHIHHILERRGYTTGKTVLFSAFAQIALVAVGILLIWASASTLVVLGGFLVVFFAYYYVLRHQHL